MKIALLFFFCALCFESEAQYTYFVASMPHDTGVPTATPSASGSRIRMDQATRRLWIWNQDNSEWVIMAQGIDIRTGCSVPASAPILGESSFAVNTCSTPELYQYTGGAWVCLTCGSSGGTVNTNATLDGDGSGGDPLKIAQQSAATSEVLTWTGATWEPSWGNPYTFVTSGASITTDVNEVLIGTLSANATFGLPTCNAANDGKHFKFIRNGTDAYSVTFDPSGTQAFGDGTLTKTSFGTISIDCTCRFSGGTGTWFFDNF